jgi:hypothetical protein
MLGFLLNIAVYPVLAMLAWAIYCLLCRRQNDNSREYTGYPHDRGIPYHGPNCPQDHNSPHCG